MSAKRFGKRLGRNYSATSLRADASIDSEEPELVGEDFEKGARGRPLPGPKVISPRYAALAAVTLMLAGALGACRTDMAPPGFNTPEATLATYIDALRRGDRVKVVTCFDPPATDFGLPGPLQIDRYAIIKSIVYGPKEIAERNAKGMSPPPALLGDVEFEVEEVTLGEKTLYLYWLRKTGSSWKIIGHCAEDIPEPDFELKDLFPDSVQ